MAKLKRFNPLRTPYKQAIVYAGTLSGRTPTALLENPIMAIQISMASIGAQQSWQAIYYNPESTFQDAIKKRFASYGYLSGLIHILASSATHYYKQATLLGHVTPCDEVRRHFMQIVANAHANFNEAPQVVDAMVAELEHAGGCASVEAPTAPAAPAEAAPA